MRRHSDESSRMPEDWEMGREGHRTETVQVMRRGVINEPDR